jgi:nucleotide-binding universal stress UspA family protein
MHPPFASTEHAATRELDVVIGHVRVSTRGVHDLHTDIDAPRPRLSGRHLVVATDGREDSDGAVRVGVALAQRDGAELQMLSVVEPPEVYDVDGIIAHDAAALASLMREARREQLLAQRDRTFPAASDWPAAIETGERVRHITAAAGTERAGLILLGLGEHGMSARLLARETALRVIRAATIPVLAVPPDAWGVPHSAIAAIDFTASSERAARAALDLLGGEGKLYLAHVEPRIAIPQGDPHSSAEQTAPWMLDRLRDIQRRLDVPLDVKVELVVLHGEPATELVAFAKQVGIQLIATGSHGRSMVGRLVLGSVSTAIVRTAHCWVLVGPSADDRMS